MVDRGVDDQFFGHLRRAVWVVLAVYDYHLKVLTRLGGKKTFDATGVVFNKTGNGPVCGLV